MDAFFSLWLQVGSIQGWLLASEISAWSPVVLTTTTLNAFLPGIMGYYGANLPVDIHFKINTLGDF